MRRLFLGQVLYAATRLLEPRAHPRPGLLRYQGAFGGLGTHT